MAGGSAAVLAGADIGVVPLAGPGVLGCVVDESNANARVATAIATNTAAAPNTFRVRPRAHRGAGMGPRMSLMRRAVNPAPWCLAALAT